MWHGIRYNIIDVANQLSFAYRGLVPELWVFVSPPTKSTKVSNFIFALEEKQEIYYEMMTVLRWESKVSEIKLKVYPLGNEAWCVIDNIFEEIHMQGRLKYTTDPTPFSFLVFVIYKTNS